MIVKQEVFVQVKQEKLLKDKQALLVHNSEQAGILVQIPKQELLVHDKYVL